MDIFDNPLATGIFTGVSHFELFLERLPVEYDKYRYFMLNEESIKNVGESLFSQSFRKPLYDSFCFSKIPPTIERLLTGSSGREPLPGSAFFPEVYDGVVLFFIDAFGWQFIEKHLSHPFLQRCMDHGILSKITTQFPSTTAAHVTTVHTGLEPRETGIYEWFQYEPKVDKVITPLLFSYAGDGLSESLIASGIPAEEFFPFTTFYERLHIKGVDSFLFQEASISGSSYSKTLGKGAHPIGYLNLQQGLKTLVELFSTPRKNKIYSFFYHSHIDFVGHRKGPHTVAFEKSILYCLNLLEKELIPLFNSSKKLALLFTADHGMVSVDPKNTLYINLEIDGFSDLLQVQSPAGSCRDLFLSIKEGRLDEALEKIRAVLGKRGEVFKVKDLAEQGFFGSGEPSSRFLERVGNLVVLPYENESIWWWEKGRFEQHFYGSHGGLTPKEMESFFLFSSTVLDKK